MQRARFEVWEGKEERPTMYVLRFQFPHKGGETRSEFVYAMEQAEFNELFGFIADYVEGGETPRG